MLQRFILFVLLVILSGCYKSESMSPLDSGSKNTGVDIANNHGFSSFDASLNQGMAPPQNNTSSEISGFSTVPTSVTNFIPVELETDDIFDLNTQENANDGGWDPECSPGETVNCSSNIGECSSGIRTCEVYGEWSACSGQLPSEEYCDDLDNDCDGTIDDHCSCLYEKASDDPGYADVGECEPFSATFHQGKFWLAQGAYWNNSKKRVYTSDNGIDWELLTDEPNYSNNGECESQELVSHEGKLYLIQGKYWSNSEKRVYTSDNGIDWELLTDEPNYPNNEKCDPIAAVSYQGRLYLIYGKYLSSSKKQVFVSDDGVQWELLTDAPNYPNMGGRGEPLSAISYEGEIWLFFGAFWNQNDNQSSRKIFTSKDGATWEERTSHAHFPKVGKCEDMAAYSDGENIFLALGKHWNNSEKAVYRQACP